jgi:hypothetical protein
LDSCGLVQLKGKKYQSIYQSSDSWVKVLLDNYKIWLPNIPWYGPDHDLTKSSSTLFDTVAVYMAHSQEYLQMEDLPLRVTDDGFTVIDEINGREVHCAVGWKDQAAFEDIVVSLISHSI